MNNCKLCDRDIPIKELSEHHLIPKTFGGKRVSENMIDLHRICHDMIHRTFTERELQHHYYTVERIKDNEDIQKFIKWVKKKSPDFYVKSKDTKERKGKRRR